MLTKKTTKRLITLIATTVVIWVLLFYRTNASKVAVRLLGGYNEQETIVVIDSTFTRGKVDTIAVFNHYVSTRGIILNPKAEVVYKYRYLSPVIKEITELDSVKVFVASVSDSLIEGDITIVNDFKGDLITAKLDYKPLFPKYISRVDTLRITKTITNTISNDKTRYGIGLSANRLQSLSILGSVTSKKGWQYIVEGNKSHQSIKIIKNF